VRRFLHSLRRRVLEKKKIDVNNVEGGYKAKITISKITTLNPFHPK